MLFVIYLLIILVDYRIESVTKVKPADLFCLSFSECPLLTRVPSVFDVNDRKINFAATYFSFINFLLDLTEIVASSTDTTDS